MGSSRNHHDKRSGGCSYKTGFIAGAITIGAIITLYIIIAGTTNFATYVGQSPLNPLVASRAGEYMFNIYLGAIALILALAAVVGVSDNYYNQCMKLNGGSSHKKARLLQGIAGIVLFMITFAVALLILINGIASRGVNVAGWILLLAGVLGILSFFLCGRKWTGILLSQATLLAFCIAAYILIVVPSENFILNRNPFSVRV